MKRTATYLAVAALLLPTLALADARVRVVHAAPFADSLDGTSVTVRVNGADTLTNVEFGDFTDYLDLPPGDYTLDVLPTGTTTVAMTADVTLADNTDYTVFATGNGTLQPLALQAVVDDNTAPAAGNLKLRVVHAAPFADSTDGTRVSVRTDIGAVVGGLADVPFFAASPYLEIPAGNYDLKVATPDGSANLIDATPVDLPAGAILDVVAVGDGVNQPLGFLALPLGPLATETPVDGSASGHWYVPGLTTTGLAFSPMPQQNRLVGSWYGWTADGEQVYYSLDSAGSLSGDGEANGGFDGESAVFTVNALSGGSFLSEDDVTATPVGTLTVDFADCRTAAATYAFEDGPTGDFDLVNITPLPGCAPSAE
ncbi:DUF4397 domain-containing protein [Chiayiivirga flava]|uniref:DUF4397 domain-containing protein n=1 Tax=Chiayiivirga flava TaxID=659595 RepID=A0A7W8D449_9GAMM|nr:DUF4397 domain-containing protein [Chiayiivirga flava]MBB5207598.1 hypothetical protein [Chiayiivirga flava]